MIAANRQCVSVWPAWLLGLCCVVPALSAHADAEAEADSRGRWRDEWSVLLGGGKSVPGWGGTQETVKTVDLILRYRHALTPVQGASWYRNRRLLLVEVPVHFLTDPSEPPMFGVYFQACWTFVNWPDRQPYLFAGGGPVYTEAEIPGTSSNLKGSYGAGGGFTLFETGGHKVGFEVRYHHLSNGGVKSPNDPLNSYKVLLGYRLDF